MSVRNNEERSGARHPDDSSAAVAATETETGVPSRGRSAHEKPQQKNLSFVVPTEFVDLPSEGRYYPEGHPLHKVDTMEIRFMTAKEEDILTSKSLLKKGIAIDRFLTSIIVDRSINVESMLVGDKNALLVAARGSGYGTEYNTKVQCPACAETQEYEFDLTNTCMMGYHTEIFRNSGYADAVTENENGTFDITLPKSNVTVSVRLLVGADEQKLAKNMKHKSKLTGHETMLTDQFRTYIVAVNGSTAQRDINTFVNAMPALDSRFLRTTYQGIAPNIDLTQHFSCESCGFEQDMEVPFTADFFWPKS
tara:strand:+ start:1233 stop:2156 length:924 start_codon:yes stop_codon:yes gene_type:complete